jgi:uridine phosphorylase
MEITVVEMTQVVDDPVVIRCGSCGGLQPEIELADLIVTQGAVRIEQTSQEFVEPGYPAVASAEVMLGLIQAAAEHTVPHHVGLTATAGGFYAAQGREVGPYRPRSAGVVDRLAAQRVLNMEMEASCLLTLASVGGFRAGVVCAVYGSRHSHGFLDDKGRATAERRCLDVGLRALELVEDMDAARGASPHWHPGITTT